MIATTENGASVGDLRRDELQVFEDGLRKEIVGFAHVYLPVRAPQLPGLVDVSTNADADRGRLFFLILDDANSGRAATATIQTVVRDLLSRLGPHDRVGMLWVSSKNQGAREFTTNHASILDAVTTFHAEVSTVERRMRVSAPLPQGPTRNPLPGDLSADFDAPSMSAAGGVGDLRGFFNDLRPYSMVADVSRYLASLPQRRKAVVYIATAATAAIGIPPDCAIQFP